MGGRAKPNWAVFVGGPRDGLREVLNPWVGNGPHLVYTAGTAPGMQRVHEYVVTAVYRKGGFHEAKAREVLFMRTLPDERPEPPPSVTSDAARLCGGPRPAGYLRGLICLLGCIGSGGPVSCLTSSSC
jgi:hypothetical protein